MKIAIFHNLPSGGAKRALFEFTKRLGKSNNLTLFNLSCSNEDFLDLRPLVKKTCTFDYKIEKKFFRFNYNLLFILPKINKIIATKINKGNYDLAFINPCFLTQAPYLLKYLTIPSVYYCSEPRREFYENIWFTPPRFKNLILHYLRMPLKWVDYQNARHANLTLVNSLYSKKNIDRIYGSNSRVNYLGVDGNKFKCNGQKRKKLVLSVGAFAPSKAHDFIIKSLSLIPSSKRPPLVITGNGGVSKLRLNELAKKLKVDLTLRENTSDNELIDWYNQAGVFAYAAVNEPFGLAPLEAMACGLIVVGVDEGGYAEAIINGKTGFLTERDPFVFAQKIETVLDNKLTEKQANTIREHIIKNWTWENSVRNLEKNFQKVLKK